MKKLLITAVTLASALIACAGAFDTQQVDLMALTKEKDGYGAPKADLVYVDAMQKGYEEIASQPDWMAKTAKQHIKITLGKWQQLHDKYVKQGANQDPAIGLIGQQRAMGNAYNIEFPVTVHHAGRYNVWVKFYRTKDIFANLYFRAVSPNGDTVRFQLIDHCDYNAAPGADGRKWLTGLPAGWEWVQIPCEFEFPGDYTFSVSKFDYSTYWRFYPEDGAAGRIFAIKDVWFSDDPNFAPNKNPVATAAETEIPAVPKGFVAATHHDPHVSLNTGVMDTQKRYYLALMQTYATYRDDPNLIDLGATDCYMDMTVDKSAGKKWGFTYHIDPAYDRWFKNLDAATKGKDINKDPTALRKGNWFGQHEQRGFCENAPEVWEDVEKTSTEEAKKLMANPNIEPYFGMWWTAWEICGTYDYGLCSLMNYRKWLEKKYGSIAKLNETWHTEYKSFEDIQRGGNFDLIFPDNAKTDEEQLNRRREIANFVDFKAYNSEGYARTIRGKAQAALKVDPKKRTHISSNLSCNNLSTCFWLRWRPLSFEDTVQITMEGSDMVGYDNYGTDDTNASYWELFYAFGDGKLTPMCREGSTHTPDPELMARMQWQLFSKGARGYATFCMQEFGWGELTKFGMQNPADDMAPSPKLAAVADNFRALNQMSHVLSPAKRSAATKKAAIYYSPVCLALTEKPYCSLFDTGPDNFIRVYEIMRACGYDVTFVTDRQILSKPEWLADIGAIFLIDATYVPKAVQQKLMDWVEKGGHIVADAQSCSRDGHGFDTPVFTEWLGIRPVQQKKMNENETAGKLAFGYSAYSFDVINRDEIWKTAVELKDTPYSTHPISKMVGKAMWSCLGYVEVKCLDGDVVMSENNGRPAWMIRKHGKGTSSYFAGYLGSSYGAGCTRLEWSDTHADYSVFRFMDAYLKWVGLKPLAVCDLPGNLKYGMRFEPPLVDHRGNAAMGITSQNRGPVDSFRVKYQMPENFKAPKMCLALVNGTRRVVEVPFSFDKKTRELSVRMPGFRVWGELLALNDCEPILSAEPVGEFKRDGYDLVDFRPGDEVSFKVRVFNPSDSKLAAGKLTCRLPDGWYYDKEMVEVPAVKAYGASGEFTFKVKAPANNVARRSKGVNFVFANDKVASSPAVEQVWFQKEPTKLPAETFGDVK